jgi:hypothetical protein
MFETSSDNAALIEVFADAAPHPHGDSALVEIYRLLPNDTDFTEFLEAGLPGMNFAYVEDPRATTPPVTRSPTSTGPACNTTARTCSA